jgi:hypothetical protein
MAFLNKKNSIEIKKEAKIQYAAINANNRA